MCNLCYIVFIFFFNDTATTEIYTLSLHDALPISVLANAVLAGVDEALAGVGHPHLRWVDDVVVAIPSVSAAAEVLEVIDRSEEHTSELQSRQYLVCRLLLEKKKKK